MYNQAVWDEPTLFNIGHKGRNGIIYETSFNEEEVIPPTLIRKTLELPNISEPEATRHYTRLTQMSYGVDTGPVPLGSCTMKYNSRLPKRLLAEPSIRDQPLTTLTLGTSQGTLKIIYEIQEWLKTITGMDSCSLQPPAGASGELSGVMIIKKYYQEKGELRDEILVPDSAHGSNPASARMGGFKVVRIPTNDKGLVDLEALKQSIGDKVAGLMLTNPNTLGLFEEKILEITSIMHDNGSLVYYDGANLNGIIGIARPGDMGFDLVHLNLHKTFMAPHGGGGPGAGAICAKKELADFLPGKIVVKKREKYGLSKPHRSIGDVSSGLFNIPGIIYAYTFILAYGPEIRKVAIHAAYNTNYFISLMKGTKGINVPYSSDTPRMHEAVFSFKELTRDTGVTVNDISKYLLDQGLHAPTIYFPLIVDEAFMIEFTETESIENIERYAEAVKKAIEEAYKNPRSLKEKPLRTSRRRLDGIRANHPKTMTPTVKYEWKRNSEKYTSG